MEITKKEGEILDFIEKFKCCRKEHIKVFVDEIQLRKRLNRLAGRNGILIENEIIRIKNSKTDLNSLREQTNTLKVLDVVAKFKKEEKIKEIEMMDRPYYVMARSAKKDVFICFTFVNEGSEMIQLKLIDNENRGNSILILENKKQIEHLKILNTKFLDVVIYNDLMKIN